jgi:hypothetical protein
MATADLYQQLLNVLNLGRDPSLACIFFPPFFRENKLSTRDKLLPRLENWHFSTWLYADGTHILLLTYPFLIQLFQRNCHTGVRLFRIKLKQDNNSFESLLSSFSCFILFK